MAQLRGGFTNFREYPFFYIWVRYSVGMTLMENTRAGFDYVILEILEAWMESER